MTVDPDDLTPDYDGGMAVRREVLGAEYVDRATAGATDVTRDFQQFITTYAWGGVWTREALDRRSRSIVTLTALVAGGHPHPRRSVTRTVTIRQLDRTRVADGRCPSGGWSLSEWRMVAVGVADGRCPSGGWWLSD